MGGAMKYAHKVDGLEWTKEQNELLSKVLQVPPSHYFGDLAHLMELEKIWTNKGDVFGREFWIRSVGGKYFVSAKRHVNDRESITVESACAENAIAWMLWSLCGGCVYKLIEELEERLHNE